MTIEELAEKISIMAKSITISASYAFMEVVKAFENFEQAMSNIAIVVDNSYQDLAEQFRELSNIFDEQSFEDFCKWEVFEKGISPRQYGLSLIRRKGTDNYVAPRGYTRPFQRNLPYQRRCYC